MNQTKLQVEASLIGSPYPFQHVLSNNNKKGMEPLTACVVPEICMYVVITTLLVLPSGPGHTQTLTKCYASFHSVLMAQLWGWGSFNGQAIIILSFHKNVNFSF